MKIRTGEMDLDFRTELIYSVGGERRVLILENSASDGIVRAERREKEEYPAGKAGKDGVRIGVRIVNEGKEEVRIEEVRMARFRRWEDLAIRDGNWKEYRLLCEGRHKNDIPSVCTLGCRDENWMDAVEALKESGDAGERGKVSPRLVSDSLTLLSHGGSCLMFAFPHASRYFVQCRVSVGEGEDPLTAAVRPGVVLMPGKAMESQELWIAWGENGEELIRQFAQENAVERERKKTPAVYCTWYYYGLTVRDEDVRMNLEQIAKKRIPYDVFQIDEGWEKVLGWWEPNERFPRPMQEIAGEIREAGLTPGLWTSPFIAHEISPVWKDHPEWRLCDRNGKPYLFPMNNTVYQVFDITNPAVWEYIREMYETFTREWGYVYHKLDFTRAAILYEDGDFYDKTIGLPEAYAKAMEAVRSGIGEDSYLLVCGGLYDPLIGIADAQRTGSDVLSMWKSNINKDGKTVPFTVKQNLLRYYMNAWWDNDPDALMLRRQAEMTRGLRLTYGLLTDEEVKTVAVNQYLGGGLLSSTEPLDRIDDDRLWQLKHLLPLVKVQARPLDLFAPGRFPGEIAVTGADRPFYQLVRINWDDEEDMDGSITADRAGFGVDTDPGRQYLVSEFFSGRYGVVSGGERIWMPPVKSHGCAVYKIQEYDPRRPYVAGGTGHFSMGEETEMLKVEKEQLLFAFTSRFPAEISYRILLPEGYVDEGGKDEVEISVSEPGRYSFSLPLIRSEQAGCRNRVNRTEN